MKSQPTRGSQLVMLRQKAGVTQKDLADTLGVSEQTVRNWEHGRHTPLLSLVQFKLLCQKVGIERISDLPDVFGPIESA